MEQKHQVRCCGPNVSVPPNSHVDALPPVWCYLEGRPLGGTRGWGEAGEQDPHNDTSALLRRGPREPASSVLSPSVSTMRRPREKEGGRLPVRKGALTRNADLGLPAPRAARHKPLLFKPARLWHLITAARADEDRSRVKGQDLPSEEQQRHAYRDTWD